MENLKNILTLNLLITNNNQALEFNTYLLTNMNKIGKAKGGKNGGKCKPLWGGSQWPSNSHCVFYPSPFLVGTLSLVSYAEANIVAPNLLIWELDLQDILL